jgi:hypothetical protein
VSIEAQYMANISTEDFVECITGPLLEVIKKPEENSKK